MSDLVNRPITISELQSDGSYLSFLHEYDMLSRLVRKENPSGNATTYAYDAADNITTITFPNGGQVHKEYDPLGNCIKEIDAMGKETQTRYNYFGKPTYIRYPGRSQPTHCRKWPHLPLRLS